jgi:hypothetical protein
MKARAKIRDAGQNAFSLLECMIAIAAFFIAVFAILALVSQSLQNARYLERPGTAATTEVLSNKLFEVDYVVQQPGGNRPEKMSVLFFRPQSKPGSLDGGNFVK